MRQRCLVKTVFVLSSWLLESTSLLICKTEGFSSVAEHADEKLPDRTGPNVYVLFRRIGAFQKKRAVVGRLQVLSLMFPICFL